MKRGDFGDGEAPRLAFAMDVRFPEPCDCSARLLFRDFALTESDSGWVMMAVVDGMVAGSDSAVAKRGAAADTPPCSESMRTNFASFPISSVYERMDFIGNSK